MRNDMSKLALMVGLFVGCLALFVAALVIAPGVPSVIAGPGGDISVTVDPPAPTESDYIKITVEVEGWLPTPCWHLKWSHTVSGNVVYITVEAFDATPPGMACVDMVIEGPFSITEEVGQLPAGFYTVQTTVTTPPCYGPFCEDMTSFEVQEVPNQPPVCSAAAPSLSEVWPPNHRMVGVNVLGVTDPDGDPISIVVTGITQDEPVNGLGDSDTSPGGAGVGTNTAQVRAERAGTPKVPGNGRMYHIHFEASDGKSGACSGVVGVGVPHDQRPGYVIVDGGELYDSIVP